VAIAAALTKYRNIRILVQKPPEYRLSGTPIEGRETPFYGAIRTGRHGLARHKATHLHDATNANFAIPPMQYNMTIIMYKLDAPIQHA
jgi:hypothetical protein